jgi:hypothetical protein
MTLAFILVLEALAWHYAICDLIKRYRRRR